MKSTMDYNQLDYLMVFHMNQKAIEKYWYTKDSQRSYRQQSLKKAAHQFITSFVILELTFCLIVKIITRKSETILYLKLLKST